MKRGRILIALLAAALGMSACATAPKDGSSITLGGPAAAGAESEDAKVLKDAMTAFQRSGYAGLAPHLGKLRAALDRAPASYPAVEQVSPRNWLVRAGEMSDGLILSVAASLAAEKAGQKNSAVVQGPNVYPTIALMLGSDAVERKAFPEALTYLERGLAMQPNDWLLLNEKGSALAGQGKLKEVLALADAALASDDMLLTMHQAPFHRRRGFVLIELGRLDEAQAAYEASLKDEPESKVAESELAYIKQQKAGKPKTPSIMTTPGPTKPQ